MTQVFDEKGNVVPVTVLEAGPVIITQIKTVAIDGYDAVQVGFGSKKIYCTVTGPDGTQSDTVMIFFRPRLGINDLRLDMHVDIMPNPVTNRQFTVTANHSVTAVEVISMVGKTVYSRSFTFDQKEVKVALNEIPGGVYQVRISYGDNQSVFKKIIIQ